MIWKFSGDLVFCSLANVYRKQKQINRSPFCNAVTFIDKNSLKLMFFLSFPCKMLRWLFNRASGLPNTSEYFPSEISFTCSLVQSAPTEAADIPQATKEATWSFIRATSGTTTKQTEHTSSLSPCSK